MTIFYIALKICALLTFIMLPLIKPKKAKSNKLQLGNLAVNEYGRISPSIAERMASHPVN